MTVAKTWRDGERVAHAHGLAMQSVWTNWQESASPFDLSWKNLIYGPGPRVIAFVLNSAINSVRTPDMLRLWGKSDTAICKLCAHTQCTLHHILVHCPYALKGHRYNWRHDSVLTNIAPVLENFILHHNQLPPCPSSTMPAITFVSSSRSGKKTRPSPKSTPRYSSVLNGYSDWKVLIDFDNNPIVFPPMIIATDERPDIVIWSASARTAILIELTCPAEEGIAAAQARKEGKYAQLVASINDSPWSAHLFTIEVGARGFVAHSVRRCFKKLGFTNRSASSLCKTLSMTAARCSYAIYLARKTKNWPIPDLLIIQQQPVRSDPDTTQTQSDPTS